MICCNFVKKRLFLFFNIKLSYYWFNREEVRQKANEKYRNCGGREKSAKYYRTNKDVLKEKSKHRYRDLSEKEKEAKQDH